MIQKMKEFLNKDTTIVGVKLPRILLLGLLSSLIMYGSIAGVVMLSTSWWVGKGDEPQHLDYVWRVAKGEIPKTSDGITYPEFRNMMKTGKSRQAAAANPPLFYVLHAPITGYFMKTHQWVK